MAFDLFIISLIVLFLELACIRWFPAHVIFLTFFTNTVLLACFLGMSVGCLLAGSRRHWLFWTPLLLCLALVSGHGVEYLHSHDLPEWLGNPGQRLKVDVGRQAEPQVVFFGAEYDGRDLADFYVPVELLGGYFFLIIALALVGPGQELGRALKRVPNRVLAYTLNILGSIVGILLFIGCSRWELGPLWWFGLVVLGIAYFLIAGAPRHRISAMPLRLNGLVFLGGCLWLVSWTCGPIWSKAPGIPSHHWSPYYRVDYNQDDRFIAVNLIGHQVMVPADNNHVPAYALPHILNRDAGGMPFKRVLIIGAGSGNDVSRALQWGAEHVDAVEIDPVILRIGTHDHPDHPYQDRDRVTAYLNDGRNFLRSCSRKYDLILFALVDSLVLHSSYSNIRLESFLFTRQALADVRRCLNPDGLFVMCNYFRQGWIVARLQKSLEEVFPEKPLVLTLPYRSMVDSDTKEGFTMFFAGNIEHLLRAFTAHPHYFLRHGQALSPQAPDGFVLKPSPAEKVQTFGLAQVSTNEYLDTAEDNWPFLYMRQRMLPDLTLRGMIVMGGVSLAFLWLVKPVRSRQGPGASPNPGSMMESPSVAEAGDCRSSLDEPKEALLVRNPAIVEPAFYKWHPHRVGFLNRAQMFFLGAGFMLIETKAVVQMALLFGSTWVVNSIVILAMLVMVLAANLVVLLFRPRSMWPFYFGLLGALALNSLIPLDQFLGHGRLVQIGGSSLLVFGPILFAGLVFGVAFSRSPEPDRDFGANIAGAILGGLTENMSMLWGFQSLIGLAIAYYALSALPNIFVFWQKVITTPLVPRFAWERESK
ncbi:MAG TPA: hypothetical protein VGY77_05490 [Gemmataceae bacterium]|nr:hypothetical protein [Gemmataceae bacterium]